MSDARQEMDAHSSRLAGVYSDFRRGDRAPVLFIRDALEGAGRIMEDPGRG